MQKLKIKKKNSLNLWHLTFYVIIGVVISLGFQRFNPFNSGNRSNVLKNIQQQKMLRVVTRNTSTSYKAEIRTRGNKSVRYIERINNYEDVLKKELSI